MLFSDVGVCLGKVSHRKQRVSDAEVIGRVLIEVHDQIGMGSSRHGVPVGRCQTLWRCGEHLSGQVLHLGRIPGILEKCHVSAIETDGPVMW